jgi:hypothetical protein
LFNNKIKDPRILNLSSLILHTQRQGNGRPFINREDEPPLTDDLKSGISWANEVAAVDDDLAGLHTEAAGAMGDEEGRRHDEEWA